MRGVLAALVFILMIPTASFAGGGTTYIEIKGGQYKPTGDLADRRFHNSSNIELSVGHRFFNHFSLEASYGHFKVEGDIEPFVIPDPLYGDVDITGHDRIDVYPMLLTGKILFPMDDGYLFIGGGVGRYKVVDYLKLEANNDFVHDKDEFRANDTVNGWHYMLGTMYDVTKRWTLGFEYKEVKTERAELTDSIFGAKETYKTDVDGRMISAFIEGRF